MKQHLYSALALCGIAYAGQTNAMTETEAVDGLAQGCYAIQSPTDGKFVKQYHSGGTINGGQNFGFKANDINDASRFYFKPSRLKHFLMTNERGLYFASRLPVEPTARSGSNKYSEWYITTEESGNGEFLYRFKNVGLNRTIRHNYSSNDFYYIDILNPQNFSSESQFKLVATTGCVAHPEMQVNVTGDEDVLKGNVNAPVRGVVDAHTHLASYEMLGGKFLNGTPFHGLGVQHALRDSAAIHGGYGVLDIIGNLIGFDDLGHRYDTRGWPNFPSWPNHQTVSHTGYYYKWIERARLGGVRMMVSHMVENKVLCKAQTTINPASIVNVNSCEAKDSVRLQIQRHYELQDYIDAQYGGPGKGWMRIVKSPEEARQVIADGKMAIIMGIEASEIFDCGVQGGCTMASVEKEMQEMYDLGVRGFFPTHRFDNKIAGSELDPTFINVGQALSAGYLFDVKQCDAVTKGASFPEGFPLVNGIPLLGDVANSIAHTPDYDPNQRSCNQQGLTELGVNVINRMIDMGFLIELDHASADATDAILKIVEERNYSGVISAHSHSQAHVDDNQLHPNSKRIIQAGGFVAPYNNNANRLTETLGLFLDEVETTQFTQGVGIGTDMSGLANQPGPRDDADALPLDYPFTSEFGFEFDKQISGVRTMDYNNEGMAHYGLLADHIQDVRERAPSRIYEAMMNSAEAYLRMWQRARDHSAAGHHNPLALKVRIINRKTSKCLDIAGEDNNINEFVRVQQSGCDVKAEDQKWIYDAGTGEIATSLNPNLCLDSRSTQHGGEVLLRNCGESQLWNKWDYDQYALKNRANGSWSLSAASGDNRIAMSNTDFGAWTKQFDLRSDRVAYVPTSFRTGMGNGCMTPHRGSFNNGTLVHITRCNNEAIQSFVYDPVDGTIRFHSNLNKCVDIPNGNTGNGTQLVVWDCNGGVNQKWDFGNDAFRSRMNSNKVIDDANGRIVIHDYHGRLNQRWRAVLN